MMARSRMKVQSNFKLAKKATHEAIEAAISHAIDEGAETTRSRIDKQAGARGYLLDSSTVFEEKGEKDGAIYLGTSDQFYWPWFEFGSVHIQAMPSIRPGHRKAKKVFLADAGDQIEKRIRRKAAVR